MSTRPKKEEAGAQFLADYERRYAAALAEWQAWDDSDREWDASFDDKQAELCEKYAVTTLIGDVAFEVVPVGR
jgi:hypothetical protein